MSWTTAFIKWLNPSIACRSRPCTVLEMRWLTRSNIRAHNDVFKNSACRTERLPAHGSGHFYTGLLFPFFNSERRLGKNIGVLFRYSTYSSPNRFTSSGSSIAFSSQKLTAMKSGLKTKRRQTDSKNRPKPKSKANTPVSIGFRVYAYGPDVTNWGGGLKGTGVPLTLRKFCTDHPIKNNAIEKNGKDKRR